MTNQAKLTVREAKVEGARLALEAACRAVCEECANRVSEPTKIGLVYIHAVGSFVERQCKASAIRALKPEEIVDGK